MFFVINVTIGQMEYQVIDQTEARRGKEQNLRDGLKKIKNICAQCVMVKQNLNIKMANIYLNETHSIFIGEILSNYYEPEENMLYYWACQDCDWEGTEAEFSSVDLPIYEECPGCNSNNLMIENAWI